MGQETALDQPGDRRCGADTAMPQALTASEAARVIRVCHRVKILAAVRNRSKPMSLTRFIMLSTLTKSTGISAEGAWSFS